MNVSRKGFIEGSALAMAGLGLTACSGGDKGAEAEAEASQNTVNAPQELIDAAKEEGTLVVYGSCEEEHVQGCVDHFKELLALRLSLSACPLARSKPKSRKRMAILPATFGLAALPTPTMWP